MTDWILNDPIICCKIWASPVGLRRDSNNIIAIYVQDSVEGMFKVA